MSLLPPACAFEAAAFSEPAHGSVEGLSFTVGPGEVVMVTGPSGAGKSLVLRGAVGLAAPKAGRVLLFGEPLADKSHDELMAMRQRLAYASENAPLLSNLTVRDNLATPLKLRGLPARMVGDRVEEVLLRLRIAEHAARRPHELSPVAQRLAILARALVVPAELLVLDEPSRGLSDERNASLAEVLLARAREGVAILLSIGDPSRWNERVTRAIHLDARAAPS